MNKSKKAQITVHEEELNNFKRIEGQIAGIQRMIKEKRYCIDILVQLSAVIGAIKRIQRNILNKHLEGCVKESFLKGDKIDSDKKIKEVIGIIKKFNNN